ncbi:serine/threonine protein kinase [Streptomyces adustus]
MANSQGSQEQTEQQNVPAPVGPAPLQAADPVSIGGFELLGRIGAGRQAVVYLGRNTHGESAAVKVLRAERRDDRRSLEAFEREVEALGLAPDSISPRLYGAGWDGRHRYTTSEYLTGPSLEELIRTGGPLGGAELQQFAVGISRLVAELHRLRIHHGDLKPRHVITGPGGRLFLIDFGVAAIGDGALRRRDLFGLASLILYAACGRFPYEGTPLEISTRTMGGRPEIGMLPRSWRNTLRSCLEPNRRFCPSAAGVLRTVGRYGSWA